MIANRRTLGRAAGVLLSLALARPARADGERAPSESDQALAQSLFDDAVRLMEKEDYAAACPKFAESQRLDPGGGTLHNLGLCREKEGKLASAWAAYNESLSSAIKDHRPEREAAARQRIAIIEGQLARIVIKVSADASTTKGLEILLDGTPVRAAAWGTPTPIDRGRHQLSATAPGKVTWSTTIDVASDGVTVNAPEVPALADAAAPTAPVVHSGGLSTQALIGWVAIGVGGASFIAGSVFGIMAFERRGRSNDQCPAERCTQLGVELNDQAKTYAWLSNIGIGVGLVAAGAGVVLVLTAPKAPKAAGIRIVPAVGPGVAGLSAVGAF